MHWQQSDVLDEWSFWHNSGKAAILLLLKFWTSASCPLHLMGNNRKLHLLAGSQCGRKSMDKQQTNTNNQKVRTYFTPLWSTYFVYTLCIHYLECTTAPIHINTLSQPANWTSFSFSHCDIFFLIWYWSTGWVLHFICDWWMKSISVLKSEPLIEHKNWILLFKWTY